MRILQTIETPNAIVRQSDNRFKIYKLYKDIEAYIMVAIKILNDEGFVLTAFVTKRIKE